MHRGRSDTVANANAILTCPENSLANFGQEMSKKELRIKHCELIR